MEIRFYEAKHKAGFRGTLEDYKKEPKNDERLLMEYRRATESGSKLTFEEYQERVK